MHVGYFKSRSYFSWFPGGLIWRNNEVWKAANVFILDKNVSQFIGTPGAFVKQFHYLFYVILRYEWEQNDVIKRNILSKWDAWNVNFKKKSFLGHSTNSPRVHCLLKYTVCSMDAYWDTCINLMIKSGCRQKLWKIDW